MGYANEHGPEPIKWDEKQRGARGGWRLAEEWEIVAITQPSPALLCSAFMMDRPNNRGGGPNRSVVPGPENREAQNWNPHCIVYIKKSGRFQMILSRAHSKLSVALVIENCVPYLRSRPAAMTAEGGGCEGVRG